MNIKLIVIDIDGTLLNSNNELSKSSITTIHKIQQRGIKVVLASGRDPQSIIPIAKQLKIDQYSQHIIGFNGAYIANIKTNEVIWKNYLLEKDSIFLFNLIRKHQLNFWAYGIDDMNDYIGYDDPIFDRTKKINFGRKISTIDDYNNLPLVYKIIIAPTTKDKLLQLKKDVLKNSHLQMTNSGFGYNEIMPIAFNKAIALEKLMNDWNIKKDEVIAFGDAMNDFEMIKSIKYGVAMENAEPELKKIAWNITLTNDNDGVAYIIKKYLLD